MIENQMIGSNTSSFPWSASTMHGTENRAGREREEHPSPVDP